MGALKTLGGIFGLVASVLVLLVCLDLYIGIGLFDPLSWYINYLFIHNLLEPMATIINLLLAVVALVGAILAFAGKKIGGALLLIVGVVWIIGTFAGASALIIFPYSAIFSWTGILEVAGSVLSMESILCVLGGIFVLAGGED